jgi:hypothetical protein
MYRSKKPIARISTYFEAFFCYFFEEKKVRLLNLSLYHIRPQSNLINSNSLNEMEIMKHSPTGFAPHL